MGNKPKLLIPDSANVEESKMFWEADRAPSRRNFRRDSTVPTVEQNKQEQRMFAVVHQMQTYVFTSATKLARLYLAENWRSNFRSAVDLARRTKLDKLLKATKTKRRDELSLVGGTPASSANNIKNTQSRSSGQIVPRKRMHQNNSSTRLDRQKQGNAETKNMGYSSKTNEFNR